MIMFQPVTKSIGTTHRAKAFHVFEPPVRFSQFPSRRKVRVSRSGVLTIFVLLMLVIAIGMLVLVVNFTWLVLNNRDMQRRSDLLALVAAEELLDEQILSDQFPSQEDDVLQAEITVHEFRLANNQVVAGALRVKSSNVTVTAGRVEDVTHPVFVDMLPFNSLRVEIHRFAQGPNPARLLIRGFGAPEAADVATASIAALDNRLIGFRPTTTVATPLAPLAISEKAWFSDRPSESVDRNANHRLELDVLLRPSAGDGTANGALIDVDGSIPLDFRLIPHQVSNGIEPDDLGTEMLGPAIPVNPLPLPATDLSPSNTDHIVEAFNAVANSADSRRVFAVYTGDFSDPLPIIGFVAATVLEAENTGGLYDQIRLAVEPVFIVHFTAVTAAKNREVPENKYIHKIRLVQ